MNGIDRIAAERKRQIEQEGWTAEHDDSEHAAGDMAMAGACYAAVGQMLSRAARMHRERLAEEAEPAAWWPFDASWWKPSPDPVRNLEKAGALIAAEIDRILRAREN